MLSYELVYIFLLEIKLTSAAAKKAWKTRRKKYGKDGHKGPAASKKPKAGKKKGRKKWGPGHPLYDWQQKQKKAGKLGGKKKGKLTKAQRSAIARKAARSRKNK